MSSKGANASPRSAMGDTQAMSVYCEILFAGFRGQRQKRAEFPYAFVRDFFAHYGSVHGFVYDETRGIGSVKFASGEVAVNCYLAVHLSLLLPPGAPREGHNETLLLCLEFAQVCPFVDPSLMRCGDVSRELLRNIPKPVAPPRRSCLAEYIVASWDYATNDTKEAKGGLVGPLVRNGPNYPCDDGREDYLDLVMAMWALLQPETNGPPAAGDTVTVLDLWWAFYHRYILHKTEPEAKRIKQAYFAFAQKPSPVQEVIRVLKTATVDSYGDAHEAKTTLDRLIHDDVYHSVCGFVCYTLRLRYDPSWASFMRDVSIRTGRPVQVVKNKDDDDDNDSPEAEAALLRMPILRAGANLVENVLFLRAVRTRGVTATGLNGSCKPKSRSSDAVDDTPDYPMDARQVDEDLYMEILHTLRGFAPRGSAAGVMSMCEEPLDFRSLEGHIGWNELHGKSHGSNAWVWCQIITVVAGALLLSWAAMIVLAHWFGFNESVAVKPPMQYRPSPERMPHFVNIGLRADL